MSWMQKKRAIMMQAASPTPSNDIVPSSWHGGTISQSGLINPNSTNGQYTDVLIPVPAGATGVKRTGQASYDGTSISFFVHAYNANEAWQSPRSNSIGVGDTVALSTWTTRPTYIRIAFLFSAASGKSMTNDIRAACYGAEWVY